MNNSLVGCQEAVVPSEVVNINAQLHGDLNHPDLQPVNELKVTLEAGLYASTIINPSIDARAQYWGWSKDMDWGFYSKPPVVASWIWITTGLFGDSEFAVRLSSPIIHGFTSIVIYFIGQTLYNSKTGLLSSIAYLTLPAVTLSSTLVSTDPSLLLFWALGLLFFVNILFIFSDLL